MCRGSSTAAAAASRRLAGVCAATAARKRQAREAEASPPTVGEGGWAVAEEWAEEEACGHIWEDGIRRFGRREVLCAGSDVAVRGWSATVQRVHLHNETVAVAYHAAPWAVATVPLADIRALDEFDCVSRDLQRVAGALALHASCALHYSGLGALAKRLMAAGEAEETGA